MSLSSGDECRAEKSRELSNLIIVNSAGVIKIVVAPRGNVARGVHFKGGILNMSAMNFLTTICF